MVDEEVVKGEDGQELIVPPTGERETYKQVNISSELTSKQVGEITTILSKYPHVMTDVPVCTNMLEYEIKLTSNDPVKLKSYPVPYNMTE